jgi:hypothetical protein
MRLVLGSRNGRTMKWLAGVVAIGVGLTLTGACSSSASSSNQEGSAQGQGAAAVQLVPATGTTSSTPTWKTAMACPKGFQGSATFKEVHADGTSTNLIAPIVNGTASAFSGTLQASIALIKTVGSIANGSTQKLFITCYSAQSGTGKTQNDMAMYITYSSDGSSYTTSATH